MVHWRRVQHDIGPADRRPVIGTPRTITYTMRSGILEAESMAADGLFFGGGGDLDPLDQCRVRYLRSVWPVPQTL